MSSSLQLALVNFPKGAYIILEGRHTTDKFFIMRSGQVQVNREVEMLEGEPGGSINPGDFFGVVSTMSSHSSIESAIALTDVSLISVHRDQYADLIKNNTPIAMKIINSFSRQLRELDEKLTHKTFKGVAEANADHLFEVGEYYVKQNQYNQAFYAYYKYLKLCPNGTNCQVAKERAKKIKPYADISSLTHPPDSLRREYKPNNMVFSEGEPGSELFIIEKGSIKITKIVNNNEVMLAILKPGDIFGEMALLENKPRSASAIAYEDSTLMAVNKTNFQKMVLAQPQVISRLTILLAERIWFIYKQLSNTLLSDPLGKLYDALLMSLEKERIGTETKRPHYFSFGPKDLINLTGMTMAEGNMAMKKLFEDSNFKIMENRIHCSNVKVLESQSSYFRKMEAMKRKKMKK